MADCPHGDPHCPCQDGDACHYEDVGDSKAWPAPEPVKVCPICLHAYSGNHCTICL